MALSNDEVANKLREIYTLMQLAGENRFRAIAFDRAAQAVASLNEDIATIIRNNRLTDIKGVGQSIAEDIQHYVEHGSIPVLDNLRDKIPASLIRWLDVSGLGPKNAYKIHTELEISTLEELKRACEDGRVASLKGLGKKSAQKIAKSIEWMQQFDERCRLDEAEEVAKPMVDLLKAHDKVLELEVAGSYRRSKETIGDIDILVAAHTNDAGPIFDSFTQHHSVVETLGRGETKSSVRTESGRQIDLRIVSEKEFPAALLYFTGSKEHNVVLRQRARQRNLSLNEYGLFRLDDNGQTDFDAPLAFNSETDLYKHLGLHYIPPELREDSGEVAYFEKHKSMPLVTRNEIKGVIHAHSTWSDGKNSIKEMADACLERGFEYLVITDHSKSAAYAGGLTQKEVERQWEEIDALNARFGQKGIHFKVFKGIESDILSDGSLDYPHAMLAGFDLIVASVHQGLDMSREKMFGRFANAIKNPFTHILGHPTGRLLLRREASNLDMNKLIELAVEHNTVIEINANPRRLDLDWRHGNKAKEAGLITSINPDAHTIDGIDDIKYGVRVARKAKFSSGRVLNTKNLENFEAWLLSLKS